MEKKNLIEELNSLTGRIDDLVRLIEHYKRERLNKSKEGQIEMKDMELQLSAMKLYQLYLDKRIYRIS